MSRTFKIEKLIGVLIFLSFTNSIFAETSNDKINMLAQKDSTLEAYTYLNEVEDDIWSIFSKVDKNSGTISSPKSIDDIRICKNLSERLSGLTSLYGKLMNGNIYHLKKKIGLYSKTLANCSSAAIDKVKKPNKKAKPPKKSLLRVVNEDLKLSELNQKDLKIVITTDVTFPGRLQSHSNRSFVFSEGNLITPIQGASTYYEHSVNQPNCDIFTNADLDAPVTIQKGTTFSIRVNEIVNSDVSISNLDYRSLTNWENIRSITCSRGIGPTDDHSTRSPIPADDFTVAEFHKHFGYSIVIASSEGSGPLVSQVSNAHINFPKDKLTMSQLKDMKIKIKAKQVLETQSASGWSLVYNNKHYFFSDRSKYLDTFSFSGSSNYVPNAPFNDNFDFISATRNELVCNISFYKDNKTEYTFNVGDTFKLVREYRLENTLLLEFDNHNKSSQNPRFIRCFREIGHKNTNKITLSDVENTLGFIKIER